MVCVVVQVIANNAHTHTYSDRVPRMKVVGVMMGASGAGKKVPISAKVLAMTLMFIRHPSCLLGPSYVKFCSKN